MGPDFLSSLKKGRARSPSLEMKRPSAVMMDILDSSWSLYTLVGLYLVRIGLNPPVGDQVTKQFARWHPKDAFVRVELEVDPAKFLESFVQILNEGVLVPRLACITRWKVAPAFR